MVYKPTNITRAPHPAGHEQLWKIRQVAECLAFGPPRSNDDDAKCPILPNEWCEYEYEYYHMSNIINRHHHESHRIHVCYIYMVTWIPSIYPLYVNAYIPAPWIRIGIDIIMWNTWGDMKCRNATGMNWMNSSMSHPFVPIFSETCEVFTVVVDEWPIAWRQCSYWTYLKT